VIVVLAIFSLKALLREPRDGMQFLSSWNGENSSMPPPIPIDLGTWDVHGIQLGAAIMRENISAVGALGWASKIHNVMFACNVDL